MIKKNFQGLRVCMLNLDFDPENDGLVEYYSSEESNNEDYHVETSLATEHYLKVGKSSLRKDDINSLFEENPKYKGSIVSKDQIFEDSECSSMKDLEFNDEEENESDNDYYKEEVELQGSSDLKDDLKRLVEEEKRSFQTFNNKEESDHLKAEQTVHLIKFGECLLDLRIRLQKCLTAANSLPAPQILKRFQSNSDIRKTNDSLKNTCAELFENLLDLQLNVIERNSKVYSVSDSNQLLEKSRKRKRKPENSWDIYGQVKDSIITPFRNSSIVKWHTRAQSYSNNALLSQKKLKSFNQDLLSQITRCLETDYDRLLSRTQVPRQDYKTFGDVTAHNEHIFDDFDFYSTLLKEFIDRKTNESSDHMNSSVQLAKLNELQSNSKKKKVFERKATKGRKLRYDVHEKLANFMAPVEFNEFPEERKDELFLTIRELYTS